MLGVLFFPLKTLSCKGATHKKPTIIASILSLSRKIFHSFYRLGIPTLTSKTQSNKNLAA